MRPLHALLAALLLGPLAAIGADAESADGEIRKVDKDAGKITIRHGEIRSLDMPAMTMLFRVRDPALLDRVKPGDKVSFRAERIDGAIVLTEVEVVP